jgi:hypothetical protein
MPDYEPAVVIDLPRGTGHGRLRLQNVICPIHPHGDGSWRMPYQKEVGLLDEVGQAVAPNLAAELADVKRRLSALEARSAQE